MLYRENRVTITPSQQTVSAVETNRNERALGWWVISSMVESFPYAANVEPPRVGISAKVGDRYVKEFYCDVDQTISVLADDVSVVVRTRDVDATIVVAAVPVPSPGPDSVFLTDLALRLGPGDVQFWDIPPCCVDVLLTRGDPNLFAQLALGVGGPGPEFYNVVPDNNISPTPKGATFVSVYNPGDLTVNYSLRWTIRP